MFRRNEDGYRDLWKWRYAAMKKLDKACFWPGS